MNPFEPHDARDFDNPYAPPRSDLVPRSTTPLTAGSLFSPNDMFSGSWPIFNERVGIFLEILWGTYGINIGPGLVLSLLVRPLLILILSTAVYIAGIRACLVGVIFSLPLAFLMFAVTYLALVGKRSGPPQKAELIWEDEL